MQVLWWSEDGIPCCSGGPKSGYLGFAHILGQLLLFGVGNAGKFNFYGSLGREFETSGDLRRKA